MRTLQQYNPGRKVVVVLELQPAPLRWQSLHGVLSANQLGIKAFRNHYAEKSESYYFEPPP